MMPSKVTLQAVRELAGRLDGLQTGARAAVKREFCGAWGISSASLSRALREVGVRCHERRDAGSRRKAVEDDVLQKIAADLVARLAPHGMLVVAGISLPNEPDTRAAFAAQHLRVMDRTLRDDWVALALRH
jgi:hypothetical protein